MTKEAAHEPEKEANALGLCVNKAGKSPSALTSVESSTSFAVDPGKVYEFSGWMKNDGVGLFGLRVTWIQGERKFSENPVVLKDTQEWKEKKATLAAPPWAQRAKVGVFVQGTDGKACFDDLSFHEKPGEKPAAIPTIRFGAVGIAFEGMKGRFTGTLQGDPAIEDGTLLLVSPDGQAIADLAGAVEPQVKIEPSSVTYEGRLYDFALQELTNYRLQAMQGAQGVELKVAVDSSSEAASAPYLRFYLAGPVAQGDIEVGKPGSSTPEKLGADGGEALQGVQELLFNAGKVPQLDLMFGKPTDVEVKREGKRRSVKIRFRGELQLALAAESVGQKRQMMEAITDLRTTLENKRWGEIDGKVKALRDTFATRFLQARYEAAWAGAGPERLEPLKKALAQVEAMVAAVGNRKAEDDAEALYKLAETYYNNKSYMVARSILTVKLINDPVNSKTKAAEKAKELLPKVEAADRRRQEVTAVEERLRNKTRNYLLTNDYKAAIEAIEKDVEYIRNKDDLPQIKALLDDWRKRLPAGPQ
ncbi:MAG: hypothetical protein NTW87_34100 [Planctomycetota bacterium]|nr:hypothetical protein [Planctomycetota bacterium]